MLSPVNQATRRENLHAETSSITAQPLHPCSTRPHSWPSVVKHLDSTARSDASLDAAALETQMKSPTQRTVKHLFAVSRNRCAFPGCELPLVEDSGTVTGEIAHIRAASESGPRFDPIQTDEERHSFDNLVLLCGRHHKVIDFEVERYTTATLVQMKRLHEGDDTAKLNPKSGDIADALIHRYQSLFVVESGGRLAISSPGAIQADSVTIKTTKSQVKFQPPTGSIGNDPCMASYVEYLIGKYQDYQKQDKGKHGSFKYMSIYNAIRREYGSKWQTLPAHQFDSLRTYLCGRIDRTRVGRIRKKRNQKNYHPFSEHNMPRDH